MLIDDGKASLETNGRPFFAEKQWALVIGVNETASPLLSPLQSAEQDAQAIANVLHHHAGFTLCRPPLLGKAADSQAIKEALIEFAQERTEDDFLLLYFSGHGIMLDGEAGEPMVYLGSANFKVLPPHQVAHLHVSLKLIRDWLYEGTEAGRVLLILDCCFSGEMGRTVSDHYLSELRRRIGYYFEGISSASDVHSGGLRLALTATGHVATTSEKDGRGFTPHLVAAVRGEASRALESDGKLTLQGLHSYLQQQLPEQQVSMSGDFAGRTCVLVRYPDKSKEQRQQQWEQGRQAEQQQHLRLALADHSAFLQNRLASFVGRAKEVEELEQCIASLLPTGGYLTVTGQAGQGKSSIIAKLVERRGVDQTAFHFIPLNRGPEHQVGLLRNLLARLTLKHDLSELYLASESRAALRDAFFALLKEVTAKGRQEVVFIDGLEQLEEEQTGVRDLSFLPTDPPPGIVLVLGTRPNDALRPLELLKPHMMYPLPDLSRHDFDLILQHRCVTLSPVLADRFYEAMQQKALYLDLVAKELAEHEQQPLEELVQRLTENPEHLFSLTIDRLKRQWRLWSDLIKPLLGLLLVVQEPLSKRHTRTILDVDQIV